MNSIKILLLCISVSLYAEDYHFEKDKKRHFAISAAMGSATGLYLEKNYKSYSYNKKIILGTSIALVPGILKELSDAQEKNNRFSRADLFYDFLGSLSGNILGQYLGKEIFIDINKKNISYKVKF